MFVWRESLGGIAGHWKKKKDLTVVTAPVAAGVLIGLVGLLMPTSLGDGSLYTEEQLRSMEHARTRVRLHVETQADGTLKGYG